MSKLDQIIDNLLRHEISKTEALAQIREIPNMPFTWVPLKLDVIDLGFTTPDDHGWVRLEIRYGYKKIKDKLKKGDKVTLFILP